MSERAEVLVHGATGFTGKLVCEALLRRGARFAVGGRSRERVEALASALGGVESCVVNVAEAESLRQAVEGRRVVCACVGPFIDHGEAMLATCARRGTHDVDTTGEQLFVARAVTRYRATAEASGACVIPAMAFEIAPADWAAHLAAERLGAAPDEIDVLYAHQGLAASATRGTKRSALAQIGAGEAMQFVGGTLVHELPASVVREFELRAGKRLTAASFPSPEAVVILSHTGARAVRTFMPMKPRQARVLHAVRGVTPLAARVGRKLLDGAIGRSEEGPSLEVRRESRFEIVVEARGGPDVARVHVTGCDRYGLTAEIQAYAAERLVAGVSASGVVAPSVAFEAASAMGALAPFGVAVV